MDRLLYQYEMNPTTWVYLSSLLTIALFFKFNRVFSVRNLDLLGLIALAPGLLMVAQGKHLGAEGAGVVQFGYGWLFVVGGLFLVRLLMDPMMIRRPLLEPNLSIGGLTFLAVCLLVFLTANVVTAELTESDLDGPRRLDMLLGRQAAPPGEESGLARHGPGYPLLHVLPSIPGKVWRGGEETLAPEEARQRSWAVTAKTAAIMSHLAIVIGLVLIGYRHFDNLKTGLAVATLYLLLPYTAQMTGRVDHVLPAALLVWAVEAYRRPLISGALLGLAIGVIYYPLFLLPLWIAFYWQRGVWRFALGVAAMLGLLVLSLIPTSADATMFFDQVKLMFGWPSLMLQHVDGFWSADWAPYIYLVLAVFAAMACSLAFFPARKNLGTLLSCSAAVMLGTQFWQPQGGGLFMAWYLPCLMLTVFRPNLEDRLAISSLGQSWLEKRRLQLRRGDKAA